MESAFVKFTKRSLLLVFVVLQLILGVIFYKFIVFTDISYENKHHLPEIKKSTSQGSKMNISRGSVGSMTEQINRTKPRINRIILNATVWNQTSGADNQSKYDITPDFDRVFLLMMVTTTPKSFQRRHVVRTTWGGTQKQIKMKKTAVYGWNVSMDVKLVFVLGISGDKETDDRLKYEGEKFGDILRVSIKENYRNIVYKILVAYGWAKTIKPWFILKADQDVYINVRKLLSWLVEPSIPQLLYSGYVHGGAPVVRQPGDAHYVSKDDLDTDTYPDYCAGPCYVISRTFLSKILAVSKEIKVFEVEDAFVGVLADRLKVAPLRTEFFKWDRSLNNRVRSWSNQDLSKFICLGDSLSTDVINYLHFKYMQL